MSADEDLLPLSALQHLAFCERQCALIHVEREWEENGRTAEGRVLHEKVDEGYTAYRRGLRQFSGVHVRSLELGLQGRLDVLELEVVSDTPNNCEFLGLMGCWALRPVEFKRGKPKAHDADRIQLCAQALCLEEMTGEVITCGSIFYGEIRRRDEVTIEAALRERTRSLARRFREMMNERVLPPAVYAPRCRACSLSNICQPKALSGPRTEAYRRELFG